MEGRKRRTASFLVLRVQFLVFGFWFLFLSFLFIVFFGFCLLFCMSPFRCECSASCGRVTMLFGARALYGAPFQRYRRGGSSNRSPLPPAPPSCLIMSGFAAGVAVVQGASSQSDTESTASASAALKSWRRRVLAERRARPGGEAAAYYLRGDLRKQQRRFPHCIFAAKHSDIADTAEDPVPEEAAEESRSLLLRSRPSSLRGSQVSSITLPVPSPALCHFDSLWAPVLCTQFLFPVFAPTRRHPDWRHPGSGEAVRAAGRWADRRRRWCRRLRASRPLFPLGFWGVSVTSLANLCPFWRLWVLYSLSQARVPAVLRGRRRGGRSRRSLPSARQALGTQNGFAHLRVPPCTWTCRAASPRSHAVPKAAECTGWRRTERRQMRLRHLCS